MNFKFAHLSDVHLGIWHAHPELRRLAMESFETAVSRIISDKAAFAVISGDFYDTSMPPIDIINFSFRQLHRLKDSGIGVYAIAGSHDYSPTGKTMLSVLESARLLKNVHLKPAVDQNTGCYIAGVEGLRGGLDKHTFENLSLNPGESRFRIFMSHVALREFAIPQMADNAVPLERLPKGFDYYANGHIHERRIEFHKGKPIVFPGAIFPCDFTELEKLGHGSFCLVQVNGEKVYPQHIELSLAETALIEISAEGKTPSQLEEEFVKEVGSRDLQNKIVLIKSKGRLSAGKKSDINWKHLADKASGAIAVKQSLNITSRDAEEIPQNIGETIQEIEMNIIKRFLGKAHMEEEDEQQLVGDIMHSLSVEKSEEESRSVFEERIRSEFRKVLDL